MNTKTIDMKLAGDTVLVSPQGYLGGAFNAFREACYAGGARFDKVLHANTAPVGNVAAVADALTRAGFELALEEALRLKVVELAAKEAVFEEITSAEGEAIAADFSARGLNLFPFQNDGVLALRDNARFLLTDQMGLGKSVQVAVALPANAPVIIVCPSVVKGSWRKELALWRPELKVAILKGRNALKVWPKAGEVFIMNYDILSDELPVGEVPGLTVVADEVHNCKNNKAKRTIRFETLAKAAARVWGLTGTPLMNQPFELWGVLSVLGLQNQAFGSFGNFIKLFNGRKGPYGMEFFGEPSVQVETCLRKVSLGRRRENVLTDLPGKIFKTIDCEIDAKTAKICDEVLKALEARGVNLEQVMGMVAQDIEVARRGAEDDFYNEDGRY